MLQKTANAPEKNQSSPRRLAVDAKYCLGRSVPLAGRLLAGLPHHPTTLFYIFSVNPAPIKIFNSQFDK
jgi:hypothetical protein